MTLILVLADVRNFHRNRLPWFPAGGEATCHGFGASRCAAHASRWRVCRGFFRSRQGAVSPRTCVGAARENPPDARESVGEFGAALLGKIDHIEMPKPARWVRQGPRVSTLALVAPLLPPL